MEQAIANRRRNRPNTQYLAAMLDDAAYALVDLGRYEEAQRYVDESRRIKLQFEQPPADTFNHNIVVQTYLFLALGRPQEAQRALSEFYVSPPLPGLLSLSMIELDLEKAEVGLVAGDAAARGFARSVKEQIAASAAAPYMRGLHARASYDEGRALLAQGDAAAALPLLDDAARTQRELLSPGSPLLLETEIARAQALRALHRMDDARQALAAAQDIAARHRPLAPHLARALQSAADGMAPRQSDAVVSR
jgi:tetratricopeptide (TPR) repeat protein